MPRVVTCKVMRDSDAYTIANFTPSKELMFRAGKGIYEETSKLLGWDSPVAIVSGSGNNAGDGYVVASLLHDAGIPCEIVLLSEKFSEDGKYYYDICKEKEIPTVVYSEDFSFNKYSTILDCLLGTGFSGDVREPMAGVIRKINKSPAKVISADINSGLNGDTGEGALFVKSDLTVSIGDFKYGHFIGKASEAMKNKVNCDIGIKIIGEYEILKENE